MKILAIDTATEACSAAVYVDGQTYQRYEVAPQKHSSLILDFCDEVLANAGIGINDIDALAFGQGPGSFTGIRIAAGVVQGIGYAVDRPIVPVSTLATIAYGAFRETGHTKIFSAIDARMQEIYWGLFQCHNDSVEAISGEHVSTAENVTFNESGEWVGAGTGWEKYQPILQTLAQNRITPRSSILYPQARDIAQLAAHQFQQGLTVTPENALPVYIRDNVTHAVRT